MDNSVIMQEEVAKPEKPAEGKRKGITGSTLKLIAVITMLIDHTAAAILARMMMVSGLREANMSGDYNMVVAWLSDNATLYFVYMVMRQIGRIAFPIYCFLLVEGFQRTRDVKKYALRLGLFAIVSEVPFDLAFNSKVLEFNYQNVFFTLLLGLLTMILCNIVEKKDWNKVLKVALEAVIFAVGMGAAQLMRTDYAARGVLCIMVIYFFRKKRLWQVITGRIAFVVALIEIPAPLAFIPVWFYNGRRGWNLKYFFYLFYPLHLLILYGICVIMGFGDVPAI